MDNSQNTSTQQPAATAPHTGNPQQIPESSLQPQTDTALQLGSPQTVNSINQLDQGSVAIPLASIPNNSTSSVTVVPAPMNTKTFLVYGGTAIIVGAIMATMVYKILRQQ